LSLTISPLEALIYKFTYTPGTSDPIQAFSFSLLSLGFLTTGQTLSFTPFPVSDGTNTFLITQGFTATSGIGGQCFNFATAGTTISPCAGTIQPGDGGFESTFSSGLPTTLGSFTPSSFGSVFESRGGTFDFPTGTLHLDI